MQVKMEIYGFFDVIYRFIIDLLLINFFIYTQSFFYAIIGSATNRVKKNRVKMVSFPILTDELVPNIKNIAYNKIYAQKNIQKQYNKFQISDL